MTPSTEELVATAFGWLGEKASPARVEAMLDQLGGLPGLLAADLAGLAAAGVPRAHAVRFLALVELVARRENPAGVKIGCAADIERIVGDDLRLAVEERLVLLCLDGRHRAISRRTVTVGSANFTLVDPGQIYGIALRYRAAAIALAHNHPSGDPTPSVQDREITRRVAAAGRILGVPLLDHLVIGLPGFASLAGLGEIPAFAAGASWAAEGTGK